MSWFSDFAKTAFNEAQKRIDKALDIDDKIDNTKLDGSVNSQNAVLDNSVVTAQANHQPQLKSSALSTHKSTTSSLTSKKRGKPLKLGSSLSKKHPIVKSSNQSAIREESSKDTLTLAQQPNEFEEISLDDSGRKSNDTLCRSISNSSEYLDDLSENTTSLSDELTSSFSLGKKNSSTSTLVSRSLEEDLNTEGILSEAKNQNNSDTGSEKEDKLLFPVQNVGSNITQGRYQVTSERSYSPCGSMTTSSEIDILDHESTISEASSAYKFTELDSRLHMVGGDMNFHTRVSPDPADSEASDIVRISGYCSSPLSVSSCDGVPVFPRPKSPVPFSDRPEISPVKNSCAASTKPSKVAISEDLVAEQFTSNSIVLVPEKNGDFFDSSVSLKQSTTNHKPLNSVENEAVLQVKGKEYEISRQSKELFKKIGTPDTDDISTELLAEERMREAHTDGNSSDEVEVPRSPDAESAHSTEVKGKVATLPDKSDDDSVGSLKERFQVYEQQLVTLSLNNANLSEENDNLRSELTNLKAESDKQFEEKQRNMLDTVEKLSNKIQDLELEKSDVDNDLASVRAELSERLTNEHVQSLLSEKEQSIQGLLQEGETMSKTHLQQSNTIKKLRAKSSEQNSANKELKEKLYKYEEENKSLKYKLAEIQGQSSEERGAVERLSEAFHDREMQLSDMRSRLEEAEEKRRAAQSTLDAAYKDIAELNKKQAAAQSDREAELKEREMMVSMKVQQEVDKLNQDHDHQTHMRLLQLGELKDSLERTEAICARKEDQLRKEIKDLQQRLQDSELRNQELSESISESTRPILRQMENLQSTYSAQTKTWEALEKSLTTRLSDAQLQLVAAQDKERSLQTITVDVKSRLVAIERQLNDARREKSCLDAELMELRTNASQYDDKLARLKKELEISERNCEEVKSKARHDKVALESQLEMEKMRSEVDRKKYLAQLEVTQKEKERLAWINRADSVTSSGGMFNTDAESVVSSTDTFNNFEVFDRQASSSAPHSGVYDSLRAAASSESSLLENLQSQLKMRDGEIAQLQGEINTLERTRSSMAEEIVRLTNDNEDLQEIAAEVENLKTSLKEMEDRHETALTMYGEKAEEAEELKLDLEDVKTMYRNQIDTLLKSS